MLVLHLLEIEKKTSIKSLLGVLLLGMTGKGLNPEG